MNGNAVRINVSLPAHLVKELRKKTPRRGFSRFLAEAAAEKITKEKRDSALKDILKAPPAFTFLKGKNASVKWVRSLRREDEKRFKRVWGLK